MGLHYSDPRCVPTPPSVHLVFSLHRTPQKQYSGVPKDPLLSPEGQAQGCVREYELETQTSQARVSRSIGAHWRLTWLPPPQTSTPGNSQKVQIGVHVLGTDILGTETLGTDRDPGSTSTDLHPLWPPTLMSSTAFLQEIPLLH